MPNGPMPKCRINNHGASQTDNAYVVCMMPLPPQIKSLEPFIHIVKPYLDQYGYLAIFFGILVEDFGIPLPGEALLVAGALFSALGSFKIEWVALLGLCGAVMGDNIGYALGSYAGRHAVLKYGHFVFLSGERLRKMETFFARHGAKVVLVARFVQGLRQFNGIVAGLSRMDLKRFVIFNAIGAGLWVGAWSVAAYYLSSELGTILSGFENFEKIILIGLGSFSFIIIVFVLIKKFVLGRREA